MSDACGKFTLDPKRSTYNWKVCAVCKTSENEHVQPLTLETKMSCDGRRAQEVAAEKHFFMLNQPFFPNGFDVHRRNPGHWDIIAKQVPGKYSAWRAANPGGETSGKDGETERAFRIRGEDGEVVLMDERWDPFRPHPRPSITFRTVTAAMLYVVEELMGESK